MKSSFLVLLGITLASCVPTRIAYETHERRQGPHQRWIRSTAVLDSRLVLPMSIGLTQQNIDKSHDFLMDVSDPESPNYAKYWSPEKIAEIFAPTTEAIDSVKNWLNDHGISGTRVNLSRGSNWLRFNATITEAESLLQTKYNVYEHEDTKRTYLACDEYSLPANLRSHVDFITPTIQFDVVLEKPSSRRELSKHEERAAPAVDPPLPGIHQGQDISSTKAIFGITTCSQYMTPDCLRSLYQIPVGTVSSNKSYLGVLEFSPQAYRQPDLNAFYDTVGVTIPGGTRPIVNLVDGAIVQQTSVNFGSNGESDLDLEYAISLVYPQPVTLYQVPGSFGTFLDAIDASFCTSGGGDNPSYDPFYSAATKDCGSFEATSVISISYSYNEPDLSAAYETRQCHEYMKLGLQGITVVIATGDSGVAGSAKQCCKYQNCAGGAYNAAYGAGYFVPSFPASCPYVTSVGATQMLPGAALTAAEEACENSIYSGGGFSNVFPAPDYQTAALAKYFKSHKPALAAGVYNNGSARGYPDISANGADFVTAVAGGLFLSYGTSAATPVVAAAFALINEARAKVGKAPVGFVNPVLYANAGALNDIKAGGNQGCGTTGFTAVEDWDPVTGLGTPNFPKLEKVFLKLP